VQGSLLPDLTPAAHAASAPQSRPTNDDPGTLPSAASTSDKPILDATGRPSQTFPVPAPVVKHGPAVVISLCNQKGGVGKTTTTINLGAALAEYGRRVLLVDFDPQGALSAGLGVPSNEFEISMYDLLIKDDVTARDILVETDTEGLDLLPSNIDLSGAEVALVTEVGREQTLLRKLAPLLDEYDYVLIDCQPSLGLLTVNALVASSSVLVPLECEYFALRGVKLLMDTVEKVKARLNPRLTVEGFVATMYDARTLHSREVLSTLVGAFGEKVFHTVISRTVKFPDATVSGQPITSFAPNSPGAEAYRALARELLAR